MNAPASKAQIAAARLAECREAHKLALEQFDAAQARGYGIDDLKIGEAVRDTAKALWTAANMDFLESDLEADRRGA